MIVKNPAFKNSFRFALCGFLCFIASLALPSIRLIALGSPAIFSGLQATAWAIGLGFESIAHVAAAHSLGKIVLGAASILNITFFITPAIQVWCRPQPRVVWGLGIVSVLGLLFGLIAPTVLEDMHPVALIGYFVWLAGYCFIIASLILAWSAIRQK